MSDGTIPPSANVRPLTATSAAQPVEKILSIPVGLPPDIPVPAQIIANADGRITLQTPQGAIVLEADLALQIGQSILVQIADGGQTIALTVDTARPPADLVRPNLASLPLSVAADIVIVHNDAPLAEFAPLQAKIVSLPIPFDDAVLPVLVKSLAQIPPQNPLPPALAEGLDKFQQLVAAIGQADLPILVKDTAPVMASKLEPLVPERAGVITNLQQILTPTAGGDPAIAKMPPQSLVHLQTISPGQSLTPEILTTLRQQMATFATPTPVTVPMTPAASNNPPQAPAVSPVPVRPLPMIGLVTQPAMPLVISPAQPPLPQAIMLMVQPDGTMQPPKLVAVITMPGPPLPADNDGVLLPMPTNAVLQNTPLPGTILIAATVPQGDASVVSTPLPAVDQNTATVKPAALHTGLGDTWPALETIFDAVALQQMPPVMQQTVPTPSPQHLPPAMLFFMAVIRNGLGEHWLNDPVVAKLPKVEKSGALVQIAHDLENIAARNDDALSADVWRPLPMPLQVDGQLLRLQWHYRHMRDDDAQERDETSVRRKKNRTRFLLNVPKTILGDIQLDGLVQEQNLEVILRTEHALPQYMETAIRGRYGAALDSTGMVGALHFQTGRDQYVRV